MFIEEIQSDWHQEGRKKGYEGEEEKKLSKDLIKHGIKTPLDELTEYDYDSSLPKEIRDRLLDYLRRKSHPGLTRVPDSPFKKTWPMLAMKRMVRWAAENGFDKVAWTPGEVQVQRYKEALQSAVDKIEWTKTDKGVQLKGYKNGSIVVDTVEKENEISDAIGKSMGDSIIESPEQSGTFEGDEITISDTGMAGFYDRMLVNEVNKFFNKATWGKAKVEVGKIDVGQHEESPPNWTVADTSTAPTASGIVEVWTLPITPEMKAKVGREGMPLFSAKKMSPVARDYLDALNSAYSQLETQAAGDMAEDVFEGLRIDVKNRLEASKGIPVPSFVQWAQKQSKELWWAARRHRPYLNPQDQAEVANVLRLHQEVPENSKRRAMQALMALLEGMEKKHYETFTMSLIMDDMIKDIDSGLLSKKEELPFGFTEREAREYQAQVADLVQATPIVADAIRRRNRFQRYLKKALVRADLLPEAVLDDERYFHHQVLEYRAAEALGESYKGIGVSSKDVRLKKKGWQRARKGSIKDYNSDYAEAEFEVIAQALGQLETKSSMERIKALVDAGPGLKMQAKSQNLSNLYKEEARRQTQQDKSGKTWTVSDVMENADPLKPFKSDIGKGLKWLGNMAKKGKLTNGSQDFTDVIEAMEEWEREDAEERHNAKEEGRDPYPVPFPFEEVGSRFWAYLNHMMKENLPGAGAAGTIYKAIAERNKFIKEYLGDKFLTAAAIKPDDHVLWKPAPGSSWYKAWSITDRLIQAVQEGESVIGKAELEKAHQILARGKDVEWIIPEGIAKTLDGYDVILDTHMLSKASRTIMSGWKKWILINPVRVIKYNVNNMSGDMDIAFAYDPKIVFKYMPAAIRDLWQDFKAKKMSPELRKEIDSAFSRGVLGSGWSVQEVSDVNQQLSFQKQLEALQGIRPGLIKRGWRNLSAYTSYRENMLRLAAYRYFKDQIAAGKKVYGASNKDEVDGIKDPEERAAKLSRELIGDYGNITHSGQWLRRHMIPFYAWMEVNAPRYVRLMRNLPHEEKSAKWLSASMAWKGTKLGIKMTGLYTLINLYNATIFPDEEDELGEAQRRQLHLILGRRDDGSIISLRIQGAFSDALSWFGGEDLHKDIADVIKGKATIWEKTKEAAAAPVVKIINGIRPDVKAFSEVLGGRTFYPDPFNPRPIRDKMEHLARIYSLNGVYSWVAGKPKRGDTWSAQLMNDVLALGTYTSDPGESAYYDTLANVYGFLQKNGRERPSGIPTDRSNALYYYRQALKYGDLKAAEKYIKKYYQLGGIDTGITQSIKRASPLAPLPADWRGIFLRSMTPDERRRYELAMRWYNETYLKGRGKVKIDQSLIERPPKYPQITKPAGGITLRNANNVMKGK